MKRIFWLLIGLSVIAEAYTYNHRLMQVYATIAPRVMLMVEEPKSQYSLCIVYAQGDDTAAALLQRMIDESYPQGLKGRVFETFILTFEEAAQVDACKGSSMLFMLDAHPEAIRNVVQKASDAGVATMAYSNRFLEEGVMLSLDLGATVRPYVNLEAAKRADVLVSDVLLRISKIYTKETVR